MNLLPRTSKDFAQTEYWDKFFRERGTKGFEWYGEFTELCGDLNKYLKKDDMILVIGCGNSMLSPDLYDTGFQQITNIDISSVAIKQMKNKVGRERTGMIFEQMDALNMCYENEKFTVIFDKGTLDALMPSDTTDDKKRSEKLFSEIDRVLKINGRYIIISLLQNHILKALLSFFSEKGWMIRITRCWEVERKKIKETGSLAIPVFMVVCVKFKKMPKIQPVLEVNVFINGKPLRVRSPEEVLRIIEGIQRTVFHFKEGKGEIEINFCRNGEDLPRYSLYVVDTSQDQRRLLTYAAFIVPHGRESEWMFGTQDGRRYLRESSGFDRLAVITFHRQQDYGTMDEIQNELRQTVLQLAPCFMPSSNESPKVPYLTLGDGIGLRRTIFSGNSEISGDYIIEEVEIEKEMFRRLIFMNNQAVVQSEVKLKKGLFGLSMHSDSLFSNLNFPFLNVHAATKDGLLKIKQMGNKMRIIRLRTFSCFTDTAIPISLGNGILSLQLRVSVKYPPEILKYGCFLGTKKNSEGKLIDSTHVASNHILYMSIPAALKTTEMLSPSIAVIGLGGGGLCLFLRKLFPEAIITGVEIDPIVVKIAKDYFGFETDDRLKVVVDDGVEFLKKKPKYDIVMFDVDSKECGSPVSCPSPQFLDSSVLEAVADILGDAGIFVTNVVTRVSVEFEELTKKIKKHFSLITWYNLKEEVNRIVFASNLKHLTKKEWKHRIEEAAIALDKIAREKLKTNNQLLDLHHLINKLSIYFIIFCVQNLPVMQ